MVTGFITRIVGSECEALATQSEEAGIPIAGDRNAGEELMRRIRSGVISPSSGRAGFLMFPSEFMH
jgi:hypothetical protein